MEVLREQADGEVVMTRREIEDGECPDEAG